MLRINPLDKSPTVLINLVAREISHPPLVSVQVDPLLEEQFQTGRVLAAISSRPGQVGRADGYILEGKELEFYIRKLKAKKGK